MKNLKLIALEVIMITVVSCEDPKKKDEEETIETHTTEGTYSAINDSTKMCFDTY